MTTALPPESRRSPLLIGSSRYELMVKIASGGMATVYVGRLTASAGFSRLVAIKRAHPHLVDDPAARLMLIEEATLASRIHHANVVAIHDVENADDELLLVMDYVEGGSLAELRRAATARSIPLPTRIGMRIALDACSGLHAVHALAGDDGRPQGLVHRDVSPQNILVGLDGTSRLSDFGVAKLAEGVSATSEGVLKGKPAYLAPEYIRGEPYTRRSDLFALGIVVWEVLTGTSLFGGKNEADTLMRVVGSEAPPPSSVVAALGPEIDAIVGQALAKQPELRQGSVLEFAGAIEDAARRLDLLATHAEVGTLVRELLGAKLERRREQLRAWQGGPVSATPLSSVAKPGRKAGSNAGEAPASSAGGDPLDAPTDIAHDAAADGALEGDTRVDVHGPLSASADGLGMDTPRSPGSALPPGAEPRKARRPIAAESTRRSLAGPMPEDPAGMNRRAGARRVAAIGAAALAGGLFAWLLHTRSGAPTDRAADGAALVAPGDQSARTATAGASSTMGASVTTPGTGRTAEPVASVAPGQEPPAAAEDGGVPSDPPPPGGGPAAPGKAAGAETEAADTAKKQGAARPKATAVGMPANPYKARLKPN